MHSYGLRDSLPGQAPKAKARISLEKGGGRWRGS